MLKNSGWNKIGDSGCRHINRGDWPRVNIRIHKNNLDSCGVREEGCRLLTKQQGNLEMLSCIIVVIKVVVTKLEWLAPAF